MKSITGEALSIMGCRLCALFLYDSGKHSLSLKALSGSDKFTQYEERLAIEDSAIGTAISRRKIIEVSDLQRTEEYHFRDLILSENLVSMLACPILYEDEVIGVLTAYTDKPHRFYNEERRIFETLAGLGAIAIQNARLYARIFQSEENLRKTERLTTLGLLSAEIAHEIRNPLTVIRLLFDSLDLKFPSGDLRHRDVAIIGEKIDQLEAIVTRVLNFGKSREDLRSRYDLCSLVDDTLHLVRLKLLQSRIEVSFFKPANSQLMVDVNKGQIQQTLLNLIINATQAMPGGGFIKVALSTAEVEGVPSALVDIEDSGAGVPDGIQDQIFDSFLSGHAQGTGLGLAIVKRILKSHNGDIALVKSGKTGTHMRFWLPLVAGS
ncbi:MAG: ATP-binding protein [Verrucomicrobia bacterium]|nr:ATP-binding protein [Verrucomicrobiota bacterium]